MSFKIGDKVEVIDGLGAGNKGVIVEVDTRYILKEVMLSIIMRMI